RHFRLVRFHRAGALVGRAVVATGRDHFRGPHSFWSLYDLCGGSDGPVRGVIQPTPEGHRIHATGSGATPGNRRGGSSSRPDATIHFVAFARRRGVRECSLHLSIATRG